MERCKFITWMWSRARQDARTRFRFRCHGLRAARSLRLASSSEKLCRPSQSAGGGQRRSPATSPIGGLRLLEHIMTTLIQTIGTLAGLFAVGMLLVVIARW